MPAAKCARSADRGKRLVSICYAFRKENRNVAPKAVDLQSIQDMDQLCAASVGPGIQISDNFAPDLPAAMASIIGQGDCDTEPREERTRCT